MIKGLFAFLLIIVAILAAVWTVYETIPSDPVTLELERIEREGIDPFDLGDTPLFAENLRFNHERISYLISASCSLKRKTAMKEAFFIIEEAVEPLSFFEVTHTQEADIEIGCSENFIKESENFYTAGEGGPSRIINTSLFKTIEKGKISLYRSREQCESPVVELHELLHVFGFSHSENPLNIMYHLSDCRQEVTSDILQTLIELYSLEAKSELRIVDIEAVKKGRYLDFNVSVINEGLIDAHNVDLTIQADGEEVDAISFGIIEIGYTRKLSAQNIRLPSRRVSSIEFTIDKEGLVSEYDTQNNNAFARVGP